MNSPSEFVDFSSIDLVNSSTPEEWRALINNKMIQQKDNLIENLKKKAINNIDACMEHVEPDIMLESLKTNLANVIKEKKFEFDYQNLLDCIVGDTLECVSQFIIKNSKDNF